MKLPRLGAFARSHPFVLIDVGAAEGIQPRWKQLLPGLRVVGFEPDERTFRDLEKSSNVVTYLNVGVGAGAGTETIYLAKKPTCSSTFPPNLPFLRRFPNPERYEVSQEYAMPVQTLDDAISNLSLPSIDFVKLDVHGAEPKILSGAKAALQRGILGLEIELSMNPIWEGQPLFNDVMAQMVALGYEIFDFRPYYWRRNDKPTGQVKGQVVFGDALFMLSPESIRDMVAKIADRDIAKAKILHAVQMFLLYGYKDCAEAVFEYSANLFAAEEQREMRACWRPLGAITRTLDFFLRRGTWKRALEILMRRADSGGRVWYLTEPRLGDFLDPK
jgi:FkbM family methyltransferase